MSEFSETYLVFLFFGGKRAQKGVAMVSKRPDMGNEQEASMSETGLRRTESRSTATMLGIAGRIRSLRFRFDRSQTQFASLIGVPSERLEAWEVGEGIDRNDLVLIADRTGASIHWLISGLSPSQIEAIRAEAVRSLDALRAAKGAEPNRGGRKSDAQVEPAGSERSGL